MRDLRSASTTRLLMAPMSAAGVSLAALGLFESFYVAPFSPSAMWYSIGLYGLVGCACGFLWGLLFGGRARRQDFGVIRLTQKAAAVPTFLLSLAAAGFLVYRDVWAESVSKAGVGGWLAMLAVPIGALLLSVIAREVGRGLTSKGTRFAFGLMLFFLSGVFLGRAVEGGGVSAPEADEARQDESRPPVVIVVADALRADALGVYGSAKATPHLDAFAKEAVVFDQAWSTSTWTRPAVASIMTGRYAATHRTMHKSDRLPAELPTLAGLLAASGYATMASVTNVNLAPTFGLGRGFEAWGYLAPRPYLGAPNLARRLFLVEIYRLIKLRFFPGSRQVSNYYAEGERINEQALELIGPSARIGQPFLAYLHFMETHDPFFAHPYDGRAVARVEEPKPALSRAPDIRGLYEQEVDHFDVLFGDLVAGLKKIGAYDRALIIVTADHGEEFGDHGHFWHGTSLYEELLRVPLLIRFPKAAGGGTRRAEPHSLVDLLPTVLAVANAAIPQGMPGKPIQAVTLVPAAIPAVVAGSDAGTDEVAGGKDGSEEPPAAVLIPQVSPRSLFAELDHQGSIVTAVRQGAYKLIQANADNPRGLKEAELYDLASDGREQKDLGAADPARVAALRQVLLAGPTAKAPGAAKTEKVQVDADTEEQLRALGYTQ